MQLTEVQCLTKDYTHNDMIEMSAVMLSTHKSSPAAELRVKNVNPTDAEAFMRSTCASSLKEEFHITRMDTIQGHTDMPTTPLAEHLIVRDLDLKHLEADGENDTPGRVVAHADWRFTPSFSLEGDAPEGGINSTSTATSFPEGFNQELHMAINTGVIEGTTKLFGGLPFFSLYGISTLTPSHLRQGIAKKLVLWAYPYADRFALPIVLYASPSGLFLYRSCGFEEYRDEDLVVDLAKWGSNEIHRHVVMLRWPKDEERLPAAWKEWKRTHRAGPPAHDAR